MLVAAQSRLGFLKGAGKSSSRRRRENRRDSALAGLLALGASEQRIRLRIGLEAVSKAGPQSRELERSHVCRRHAGPGRDLAAHREQLKGLVDRDC